MSDRETGEYGAGVDRDTGANVGDTGTPELHEAELDDPQEDDGSDGD